LKEAKRRNEQAQLRARVNGGSHVVFATWGKPLFPLRYFFSAVTQQSGTGTFLGKLWIQVNPCRMGGALYTHKLSTHLIFGICEDRTGKERSFLSVRFTPGVP